MESVARQTAHVREHDQYDATLRNDRQVASRVDYEKGSYKCHVLYPAFLGSTGWQPVSLCSLPRQGNRLRENCVPKDVVARAAGNYTPAACAPQTADAFAAQATRVRYPGALAEFAVTSSCIAGSLQRRCKSWTICSTKAACDRGKTKKYLGPFPAEDEITRFSDRNFGSRLTLVSSRSIVRANGRPALRATNMSLRGSSFVATSAPNKLAGIRPLTPRLRRADAPRPLTHGAAHRMVSPRTFSLSKMDASRVGNVNGRLGGTSRSAGPFNFLHASQIFAFMARKILGAK